VDIKGSTRIIGIFGDPVAHTLSPAIQNAAFAALGLGFVYVPFHVARKRLGEAVEGVRALGLAGVNITIPHKVAVMEHLDEIEAHAKEIGAVNTVVNDGGRLVGHNTDGAGFLKSLTEETGFNVSGKKVLVIGAGGAARAILYSVLSENPAFVLLLNRTVEKAEALVDALGPGFKGVELNAGPLSGMLDAAPTADLVINTTSLGMEGNAPLDFPVEALSDGAVVADIVYSPLKTPLLTRAEARGLTVHNGLSMLIGQGAIGFELWTGRKAPVEAMKEAALKALGAGGR
jgi:shikimate dehydrogenase